MDDDLRRLVRLEPNLRRRALICQLTRDFFAGQGFLEVETPVRTPDIAPEAYIVPFESEGWFLSTSPELYMKRLLAAGWDKLFQLSHCFRQGERGRFHHPEFTLLEWYRTGADYIQMLEDTEKLVTTLAVQLGLGTRIVYQNQHIDLSTPWPRLTVRQAFLKAAGWDPVAQPDPLRFDTDLVDRVIPSFDGRPTILLEYPAALASLARVKPGHPEVAERGEVFIAGLEIANAFSELNDRNEQERRFREEIEQIEKEQKRQAVMPRQFLEVLHRLPECGGIAVGFDRLVMLLCNAGCIGEVVAFAEDSN